MISDSFPQRLGMVVGARGKRSSALAENYRRLGQANERGGVSQTGTRTNKAKLLLGANPSSMGDRTSYMAILRVVSRSAYIGPVQQDG